MISYIVSQTQLAPKSVEQTVKLLNEDCTIPFIARYRKEATGNLDEVQIGDIVTYKEQFEALEKRKASVLKALLEQEVVTADLKAKINDLYYMSNIYEINSFNKIVLEW